MSLAERLPERLGYLATPAETYGVHQFDDDVDAFLDSASADDMQTLAAISERVRTNGDYPAVIAWINEHDIAQDEEAAKLYFLFGLLVVADLAFD